MTILFSMWMNTSLFWLKLCEASANCSYQNSESYCGNGKIHRRACRSHFVQHRNRQGNSVPPKIRERGRWYADIEAGLYNAIHHACCSKQIYNHEANDLVTVSGKCCETDTLIKDILLPKCERGDILAVLNTGAYNYSMASHLNRLQVPAVVLLNG
jgi:hypothetical protein